MPRSNADGLVVPGVGAFAACMAGLLEVRGDQIIDRRLAGSRPVLGICVGMQVMFDEGVEHGLHTKGCGAVARHRASGSMRRCCRTWAGTRSTPRPGRGCWPASIPGPASTSCTPTRRWTLPMPPAAWMTAPLISWAEHGEPFIAAVENGPLCATQFHPEKSGDAGAALLANWLEMVR